jgi:hypothetical protein
MLRLEFAMAVAQVVRQAPPLDAPMLRYGMCRGSSGGGPMQAMVTDDNS